jgi:hypothetical protein
LSPWLGPAVAVQIRPDRIVRSAHR